MGMAVSGRSVRTIPVIVEVSLTTKSSQTASCNRPSFAVNLEISGGQASSSLLHLQRRDHLSHSISIPSQLNGLADVFGRGGGAGQRDPAVGGGDGDLDDGER